MVLFFPQQLPLVCFNNSCILHRTAVVNITEHDMKGLIILDHVPVWTSNHRRREPVEMFVNQYVHVSCFLTTLPLFKHVFLTLQPPQAE